MVELTAGSGERGSVERRGQPGRRGVPDGGGGLRPAGRARPRRSTPTSAGGCCAATGRASGAGASTSGARWTPCSRCDPAAPSPPGRDARTRAPGGAPGTRTGSPLSTKSTGAPEARVRPGGWLRSSSWRGCWGWAVLPLPLRPPGGTLEDGPGRRWPCRSAQGGAAPRRCGSTSASGPSTPSTVAVAAGRPVRFLATNSGAIPHALAVEGAGGLRRDGHASAAPRTRPPGGHVRRARSIYDLFCPIGVGQHRLLGQDGRLAVVEPAPGVRYPQSGEEAEAVVLLAVLGPLVPEAPQTAAGASRRSHGGSAHRDACRGPDRSPKSPPLRTANG